jgi:hypothetical protein
VADDPDRVAVPPGRYSVQTPRVSVGDPAIRTVVSWQENCDATVVRAVNDRDTLIQADERSGSGVFENDVGGWGGARNGGLATTTRSKNDEADPEQQR